MVRSVHRIFFLPVFVLALLLSSCATFEDTPAPPEIALNPEAEPDHDRSFRGMYKGVLTTRSSSGMFKLDIKNSEDETILLNGSYRGAPFALEGTEEYLTDEDEYRYSFQGTSAGDEYSIAFTTEISLQGEIDRANTSFTADGESVHVNMMKEKADELIRVYEGRYTGDSDGTWNYIVREKVISGYYAGDGEDDFQGRLDSDTGALWVWGENGHMLARGVIENDGSTHGVWTYTEGASYSENTPQSAYPPPDSSQDEDSTNRWSGERTL